MSYRSHTTIPTRSSSTASLWLVGLVIVVAVLAYAWHLYHSAQQEEVERDKATASSVLQVYQQGHRDAMEAVFSAQGISLEQVCRAAGRAQAPEQFQ